MRLARALAISLAVHAVLLLILWQRQAPPRPQAAVPLAVQLLIAPAPRATAAEPGGIVQPAPASPLPPSTPATPAVPTRRIDWREAAHAVLRESATAPSPFLAPPLDRPAFGTGRAAASPELSNAFRPLPRARKICGDAEGVVDLGIRQIRMPVARPCKDKEEEWRSPDGMK